MSANEALIFGVGLLALSNPLIGLSAFLELTARYPRPVRRKVAARAAIAVLVIFLCAVWIGQWLLDLLGISVPTLQVAGGLIVLLLALPMVLSASSVSRSVDDDLPLEPDRWRAEAIVPLALPLTAGPGSIAFIIVKASRFDDFGDLTSLTVVVAIVALVIGITYFFAETISRVIGDVGIEIITRLMGVILAAIGVRLITNGLVVLLPGLA